MEDSALLSVGKDGERRRFAWWERTVYAVPPMRGEEFGRWKTVCCGGRHVGTNNGKLMISDSLGRADISLGHSSPTLQRGQR